jgi:hypothetical protein
LEVVLLWLWLLRKRRVDLLEDFSVDDIERHGQARGWLGRGGVINMVILRGSPTLERATYSCSWAKTGARK